MAQQPTESSFLLDTDKGYEEEEYSLENQRIEMSHTIFLQLGFCTAPLYTEPTHQSESEDLSSKHQREFSGGRHQASGWKSLKTLYWWLQSEHSYFVCLLPSEQGSFPCIC